MSTFPGVQQTVWSQAQYRDAKGQARDRLSERKKYKSGKSIKLMVAHLVIILCQKGGDIAVRKG